jgi:AcrR family transcriptional regulator
VPRSGADARRRLQQAALELYGERGYDQTTTAEIAARAGVTERTFFRHFADKREVLFDGETALLTALTDAVAKAPAALAPLEALRWAFGSVEQLFIDGRPFAEPRQKVVAATPALRERALAKTAVLIAGLADALARRGVEPRLATLAAQTGMAAFSHALTAWIDDPGTNLDQHLFRAFEELRGLSATPREAAMSRR